MTHWKESLFSKVAWSQISWVHFYGLLQPSPIVSKKALAPMPLGPLLRILLAITRCTSVEPWSPSAKPFAVYIVAFQNISWIPSRIPGFWSWGLLHKIMFANWVSRLRSWGLWLRALWRFMQSCLRILVPSECHGFRYSNPLSFTKNIVCKSQSGVMGSIA